MKWSYKTYTQRQDELTKWHSWFAWYPVFDNGQAFWLELVERRKVVIFSATMVSLEFCFWEYRNKEKLNELSKETRG